MTYITVRSKIYWCVCGWQTSNVAGYNILYITLF